MGINMHVAAKICFGIGALICLGGILMTMGGSANLDDAGEWDPVEKSEWNGEQGTYDYSGGDMLVMVRDDVRCDTFSMTMKNSTSDSQYKNEDCDPEDESRPAGYGDDPAGWYHVGTISSRDYSKGEYTIDASSEIYLVDGWEILVEEGTEAVTGGLAILGGGSALCCGFLFLILGGIFALTMKTPDKTQINVSQGNVPVGSSASDAQSTENSETDPEWWNKEK